MWLHQWRGIGILIKCNMSPGADGPPPHTKMKFLTLKLFQFVYSLTISKSINVILKFLQSSIMHTNLYIFSSLTNNRYVQDLRLIPISLINKLNSKSPQVGALWNTGIGKNWIRQDSIF